MCSCHRGDQQIALDTQQAGNLVADHDSASSDDDDPFADQCCAIHYAACSGAPAVVAALAEAGADVNISFHSLFRSVAPPLYLAAERGHRDTVAALLSAGASPDAPVPPRMWTSLHVACASGHADVVVTLLKGGADWATTCRDGLSAKALGEQRLCSLASDRERGTLERALVGQGYEPVSHEARMSGVTAAGNWIRCIYCSLALVLRDCQCVLCRWHYSCQNCGFVYAAGKMGTSNCDERRKGAMQK
eukprot:SAG31_NODE_1733_length_7417_cov_1.994397_2_plen_247_part_00